MQTIKKLIPLSICTLVFASALFSIPGHADLGVLPSQKDETKPLTSRWFIETIKPGESVKRSVRISNTGGSNIDVELYNKDSIQTPEGTFTFKENQDKDTQAGTWITLSKNKVTVAPNNAEDVEFTVTVPKDTKPGEYAAVISGQEVKKNKNNQTLDVVTRIGARVYITVPGELRTKSTVEGFGFLSPKSPNYQKFLMARLRQPHDDTFVEMNFKNEGNIFTKSKGELKISGPTGETTLGFDRDLAPIADPAYFLISGDKDGKALKIKPGKYKAVLKFENSPVISYNKDSITDQSKTREYTTEFEYTQDIIDQMKADFEKLASERSVQEKAAQDAGSKLEIIDETKQEASVDNTLLYAVIGLIALCAVLSGVLVFLYIRKKSDKSVDTKTENQK